MQDKDILVSLSQVRAALAVVMSSENAVAGWFEEISKQTQAELRTQFTQPYMQRVRPSLVAFVLLMEQKLRKHDENTAKPKPWDTQQADSILAHLTDEIEEFKLALRQGTAEELSLEAADVANCLHVLVDRMTGCQYGPRGQGKGV